MTEKEKAYDEAIERAKKLYGNRITEEIFPELKESQDEKIRKWIIDDIMYNMMNEPLSNSEYKKKAEKAIAWLEKQRYKDKLIQELGEYKVKYTQEVLEKYINSISNKDDERLRKTTIAFLKDFAEQGYENAVECIDWLEKQGKKSTDKPRFKVGDWVVFIKSGSIYQVEKKENYEYTLRYILGSSMCLPFSNEELIREWTIQDAKDGDVLACNEEILLFKSYLAQERISLYCWYNRQTNNFHSKEVVDILMSKINKIHPATKEQRDLLFQKIREASYKWNDKTKTLEKLV